MKPKPTRRPSRAVLAERERCARVTEYERATIAATLIRFKRVAERAGAAPQGKP